MHVVSLSRPWRWVGGQLMPARGLWLTAEWWRDSTNSGWTTYSIYTLKYISDLTECSFSHFFNYKLLFWTLLKTKLGVFLGSVYPCNKGCYITGQNLTWSINPSNNFEWQKQCIQVLNVNAKWLHWHCRLFLLTKVSCVIQFQSFNIH